MVSVRGKLRAAKLTSRCERRLKPTQKAATESASVSQSPARNIFFSERSGTLQLRPPSASSNDCIIPKTRTTTSKLIFRGVQSEPTFTDSMAAARKTTEQVHAQAHQWKNSTFRSRW